MKESRPSFSFLLQSLSSTEGSQISSDDDLSQPSVLGGPLELGEKLFQELNQTYIRQNLH